MPTERVLTKCDQCREFWEERNQRGIIGEPPCETCRIDLLPENEIAFTIYSMVKSQCETRFNGERDFEIDLHHSSLWKAIEKYPGGIKDEWQTFTKISRAWHSAQQLKRDSEE